jgi:hypothetical protein
MPIRTSPRRRRGKPSRKIDSLQQKARDAVRRYQREQRAATRTARAAKEAA